MVLKNTLLACTPRENKSKIGLTIEASANATTTTLDWKGLLGGSNASGNATNTIVLSLVGWNGSPRVPFEANEKGWPMVVVVARGANGFEASVVVITGWSL